LRGVEQVGQKRRAFESQVLLPPQFEEEGGGRDKRGGGGHAECEQEQASSGTAKKMKTREKEQAGEGASPENIHKARREGDEEHANLQHTLAKRKGGGKPYPTRRGNENPADLLLKNVIEEAYERHLEGNTSVVSIYPIDTY
jgi:hypothetical protein